MDRRGFLKNSSMFAGSALFCGLANGQSSIRRDKRPDVLFIAIEDIAAIMGCYGHPLVKTPNIDKLARSGILFERAYCQVAVCNPSRASVSTGLRPETTGVYNNSVDWRGRIPKGHLTLPEFFQANGYETITCGKIHHHERYFKDARSGAQAREDRMWNRKLPAPSKRYIRPPVRPKARRPKWLKEDDYINRSLEWGPSGLPDEQQRDGAIARAVARELKIYRTKPRYMAVGFHAPHYPFRTPDKYFKWYPPEKMELAKSPANDLADVPFQYSSFNTTDDRWLDETEKKQVLSAYYACVSFIDACVGVILDALKESGRWENTVICLWGDHGMHLGEHFLWRKYTLFEGSTRVPFLIVAPGISKSGATCKRVVELVDIYPTLVDLCGLQIPGQLDGISMKPLLKDPGRPWKKAAFSSKSASNRSLRTERWRYTQWGGPQKAELYDHYNDPGEFENL
ncbi:MAG: sulfatase, partial [Planctomycetes bacterium]|nr:sulfatase [Planctomycetota bacterium]